MKKIYTSVSKLEFLGTLAAMRPSVFFRTTKISDSSAEVSQTDIEKGGHASHMAMAGIFSANIFSSEWGMWFLVALALLGVTLWSRDMLLNLQSYYHVKRLYVISVLGLALLFVSALMGKHEFLAPISVGTIAMLVATIVDVVRPNISPAPKRLLHTLQAIVATLVACVLFFAMFGWAYSLTPLMVVSLVLVMRYMIFRVNTGRE